MAYNEGIKVVTERTDTPEHHWLLEPGFHLLNMLEGVWLVDENHPKYKDCLNTAIDIAITFGDQQSKDKYSKLLKIHNDATEKNN